MLKDFEKERHRALNEFYEKEKNLFRICGNGDLWNSRTKRFFFFLVLDFKMADKREGASETAVQKQMKTKLEEMWKELQSNLPSVNFDNDVSGYLVD